MQIFERPLWAGPEATLPLVGDLHPFERERRRIMFRSAFIAMTLSLVILMAWMFSQAARSNIEAPHITVARLIDIGVPPSIEQAVRQIAVSAPAVAPPIGVPEPVPDFVATNMTVATNAEMAEALVPLTASDLGSGGDSIVVRFDRGAIENPSPDAFVAVEEMPVLIRGEAPVYPELARAAEVEATVVLRVLVLTNGKVGDVLVVSGHPMLNDAAVAAARNDVFRPGMQQHHPVACWILKSFVFRLN